MVTQVECWPFLDLVCIEPILNLGSLLAVFIGIAGLIGIYFAYRQFRLGQRAQNIQVATYLHGQFMGDINRIKFAYRLDYDRQEGGYRFEEGKFRLSDDERNLDNLLYYFSFIGGLVRRGDIDIDDLGWLKSWIKMTLGTQSVADYFAFLKRPDEVPDHDSFSDAIYLYGRFFGFSSQEYKNLSSIYLNDKT